MRDKSFGMQAGTNRLELAGHGDVVDDVGERAPRLSTTVGDSGSGKALDIEVTAVRTVGQKCLEVRGNQRLGTSSWAEKNIHEGLNLFWIKVQMRQNPRQTFICTPTLHHQATDDFVESRRKIDKYRQTRNMRSSATLLEGPKYMAGNIRPAADASTDLGLEHVRGGVVVEGPT